MKRRHGKPVCGDCGSVMVRYSPGNVDHVLATAPEPAWACVVASPDLLQLAYNALQQQDGRALAAVVQLGAMRLQARAKRASQPAGGPG